MLLCVFEFAFSNHLLASSLSDIVSTLGDWGLQCCVWCQAMVMLSQSSRALDFQIYHSSEKIYEKEYHMRH